MADSSSDPPPTLSTATIDSKRHQSPWSRREKIKRVLWGLVQSSIFRLSLPNAYRWRAMQLRWFGATIGPDVRIRRTARVEIPWHLTIGQHTAIGEFAILYCLGPITLGEYVTVSQYAHLCAGTHETHDREMRLLRPPITIGDDAWIAADAFVGPGVTVGARTIVGARSSVFRDLPAGVIAAGSPARVLRAREFNDGGVPGRGAAVATPP